MLDLRAWPAGGPGQQAERIQYRVTTALVLLGSACYMGDGVPVDHAQAVRCDIRFVLRVGHGSAEPIVTQPKLTALVEDYSSPRRFRTKSKRAAHS